MPSFRAISVITALACAAFSFAAPQPISNGLVAVEARDSGVTSVPQILQRVTGDLQPIVDQLFYITSDNNTASIVNPILGDVKVILGGAISDVKALTSATADAALDTVNYTVQDLAPLIAVVVNLVLIALGKVLQLLSVAEYQLIFPVLCEVGTLVGNLLTLILAIVDAKGTLAVLLATLLPLIHRVLAIIVNLGITSVFSSLGVNAFNN
ncbi:hypothetical protein VKT23_011566 [Stygiomarasmius scandens]|uniref:Uncharacterized protein n=1 Tax=Marasmiellus scandens TaxID=2682957 RepID=A0ABR1JB72_9AGAR